MTGHRARTDDYQGSVLGGVREHSDGMDGNRFAGHGDVGVLSTHPASASRSSRSPAEARSAAFAMATYWDPTGVNGRTCCQAWIATNGALLRDAASKAIPIALSETAEPSTPTTMRRAFGSACSLTTATGQDACRLTC
jgi:hypothetical protein